MNNIIIDRYGNNKLKEIFSSNLFWVGLALKIILSMSFASSYLTAYFIPFVNYYFESGFSNPYEFFSNSNNKDIFPYPTFMLIIMAIPRVFFSFMSNFEISSFSIFIYRLPLLFADFLILIVLSRLIKQNIRKIIIYYWLSPVLIYISYIHGQLDAIPVAVLFVSLYFLFKSKIFLATVFLSLAVCTKTSMIAALPFYLLYLFIAKDMNVLNIILHFFLILLILILVNSMFIFQPGFFEMVLQNKEQAKVLAFNYVFENGNVIYFLPLSYLLLVLYAASFKYLSKDVFMLFLGFSFSVIMFMVTPMQGWYYWLIPFFTYYLSKNDSSSLYIPGIFFLLQLSYFIYFLVIPQSDFISTLKVLSPSLTNVDNIYFYFRSMGFNLDQIVYLSYTLLQGLLLTLSILLYNNGIRSHLNEKIFSKPFIVGISGDSGAGKTITSEVLTRVFGNSSSTTVHGDDMHKWERGDDNWSFLTHLNPKSNFLYNEINALKEIKHGETINRRHYNHETGKFDKPGKIKPKNVIIFEGLHSFYIKQMRDLIDLKIFLKPTESIRANWKIERDNVKRGHSKDKILGEIEARENDSQKFISTQSQFADIIIETLQYNPHSMKVIFTTSNSFYLEPFIMQFSNVSSLKINHEYIEQDKQKIEFEGSIKSSEIDLISYRLGISEFVDNLNNDDPQWEDNTLGISQLLILQCILLNYRNL